MPDPASDRAKNAAAEIRTSFTGQYEYPACKDCHQGWSWPRNLRLFHVNSAAKAVNPRTKSTIVPFLGHNPVTGAPTLPPELFRQIHLVFSKKFRSQALVTSFHFDKTSGRVFYEPPGDSPEASGYARMITLNSWWVDLAKAMVHTTLQFGDLTATLLFVADCFENPELAMYHTYSMIFACMWAAIVVCWFFVALAEAVKEWRMRSHPNIGDITLLPGLADEWFAYMALVLFVFFGLDSLIVNVVTYLHPWKGIQPYAAFKNQGTRAFVVGFPGESHFKMENWSGQFIILPLRFTTTILSFGYKAFLLGVIWDMDGPQVFLCLTLMTSLCSMAIIIRKWRFLRIARRKWWKQKKKAMINASRGPGFDTGWRDRVFEYRHFSSGPRACIRAICGLFLAPIVHLCCRRAKPGENDSCVCCGRPHEAASLVQTRLQEPPHAVDELVMLANDYRLFSDARHGVLQPCDLGRVVKIGEFVHGYGHRVLVQGVKDAQEYSEQHHLEYFENTWWYDSCALRRATPEEAYIAQHSARGADSGLRNIHRIAGQIRAAGFQLSDELQKIESESDRRMAYEIVQKAIADVMEPEFLPVDPSVDPTTPKAVSVNSFQDAKEHFKFEAPLKHPSSGSEEMVNYESTNLDSPHVLRSDPCQATCSADLTPREAAMRKAFQAAAISDVESPVATPELDEFAGLRSQVLAACGHKRCCLAVLGGLTVQRPDSVEMLKHVAESMSNQDALRLNLTVVTASNQGVEQRLTDSCTKAVSIVNLVQLHSAVPSRKGVDIVAGATYVAQRQALVTVADIVIVIEGARDTVEDARSAFQRGAKIIPVIKYGGAAAGGAHGLPDEILDAPPWAQPEDWAVLSNHSGAKRTGGAVASLVEQALRHS